MNEEYSSESNTNKDNLDLDSLPSITFEDKMVSFLSNIVVGNSAKNQRTLGLMLMAAAGVFLTLGNSLVQYVYQKSHVNLSSFQVLFVRSVIQAIFTLAFMIYGKVHPYGERKKNVIALVAMGIAEVIAIVFVYLALEKMPVGDATVIQFTAPVFTVLFSFVFLRKGCGCFDAVCGLFSFVGVIFIAKPDLIIDTYHHVIHVHQHNVMQKHGNTTLSKEEIQHNHDYLIGGIYALLAAMCLSLFFILNKLNGMKLDVTLTIMYPSVFGIIVAPIAMLINKEKFIITQMEGEYWGLLIVVGFVSFIGLMFMAEALQLEDAGPAVLIRNCDVIYAYLLQYLLMHHPPTISAIIGTVIVLGFSSLMALNRVFNLQRKCCGDRFRCCESAENADEDGDEEETHFMLRKGYKDDNDDEDEEFNT